MNWKVGTTANLTVTAVAALCMAFGSEAKAACRFLGSGPSFPSSKETAALQLPPPASAALMALQTGQEEGEQQKASGKQSTIVGMWIIDIFPEGSTESTDHGMEQFSSDGNELINSAGFAPASENMCFGIWQAAGPRRVTLTHLGWDFNVTNGAFIGTARLVATLKLSLDGNSYDGTYSQDEVDPFGNVIFPLTHGTIKGKRFKPATSPADIDPR